jgi:hypothetical protein
MAHGNLVMRESISPLFCQSDAFNAWEKMPQPHFQKLSIDFTTEIRGDSA